MRGSDYGCLVSSCEAGSSTWSPPSPSCSPTRAGRPGSDGIEQEASLHSAFLRQEIVLLLPVHRCGQ